jgi:hypothetical protein
VDIEVKQPLKTILSLRLEDQHLAKLKALARTQRTGITTLARNLLSDALDHAGGQLMPRHALPRVAEEPGPYAAGEPAYYILSRRELEHAATLSNEAVLRVLLEAIQTKAVAVTKQSPELFKKAQELEAARR